MQSKWGPRIFWAVLFIMAAAGIYVWFDDPADDVPTKFGSSASAMVTIKPNVRGVLLELGLKDRVSTSYIGHVKLSKGKVLQFYPIKGTLSSNTTGTRFEGKSNPTDTEAGPLVYRLVYQAEAEETLTLTLGTENVAISVADLTSEKPQLFKDNNIRLTGQVARQLFENDSNSDDLYPQLTRDSQGNDYLLYMNASRNKGIDVEALTAGSFESMETPIVGVTLKMSKCVDGVWQYAEQVVPKIESCLNPTMTVVPDGRIYVAWLQKALDGWDIYYTFKEQGLSWNTPVKFTTKPGAISQLVAAADSKNRVWLAWQTWKEDHYDIFAAVINDEKHLYRMPGLVAEHPREQEGRWFPTLAGDGLGNMYLAWSVFTQGRFDIEAVKLFDNMVKGKATTIASAANVDKLRPSLCCDKENNLWLAYEESKLPSNFGDGLMPESTIRLRRWRVDGSIDELPALPEMPTPDGKMTQRFRFPRLSFTNEGTLVLCCQLNRNLVYSTWQEAGWKAPEPLSDWAAIVQTTSPGLYQNGYVVGVHETLDLNGRLRLQVAAKPEAIAKVVPSKLAAVKEEAVVDARWKPFTELARQFRKRSDDLVLSKRYLLRGLIVLPKSVNDYASDPWGYGARALEQGMHDWVMIPQDNVSPAAAMWLNGQTAMTLNNTSDRNFLLGYYRQVLGQREPVLLSDTRNNESALLPLKDLESFRRVSERASKININEATDRLMMQTFLSQHQRLGFALTDNWKMMAALTQPGNFQNDSLEKQLKPLWYPEATPIRPTPQALRVVAFANGKSNDHLVEALRERRFYIATDDIYLIVRCDRKLPGDIFQSSFKPNINVTVQGTGKIKAVEIWQDNKLVKSEAPPGQAAILEFTDEKVDIQWHSYTVRVVQENGAEAISQPMWIRCLP